MKEIKIDFSDFWGGYDPHNNFWTLVLQKLNIPYTVVSDNSDILFCSCFGINWTRKSSKKKILLEKDDPGYNPIFDPKSMPSEHLQMTN